MISRTRVLIVDDSVIVRRMLSDACAADPELEVVGTAANGRLALAKIQSTPCDVVTLDVEMPGADGLETLQEIRRHHPRLPVVMCSSLTERGAATTLEALARGATDYITKPGTTGGPAARGLTSFLAELRVKLKGVARPQLSGGRRDLGGGRRTGAVSPHREGSASVAAVSIGVSTGGPNALAVLLPALPANFPAPIFIVQHMPPVFTRMLAERLNAAASLPVREACAGEPVEAGTAYLAPGDWHMRVTRDAGRSSIALDQGTPESSCRPAVDVLFRSVVEVYGAGCLGVVMTGMGRDGFRGAELIRAAGGQIVAQDEDTSVVWGMPGYVVNAGLADEVLPLAEIASGIVRRVRQAPGAAEARPRRG